TQRQDLEQEGLVVSSPGAAQETIPLVPRPTTAHRLRTPAMAQAPVPAKHPGPLHPLVQRYRPAPDAVLNVALLLEEDCRAKQAGLEHRGVHAVRFTVPCAPAGVVAELVEEAVVARIRRAGAHRERMERRHHLQGTVAGLVTVRQSEADGVEGCSQVEADGGD